MRILLIARRYWPAIGGVETLLRMVATGLAERNDVTVLAHRIDHGPMSRLTDSLSPPPSFDPFTDGAAHVVPLRISLSRRSLLTPLGLQVVPLLRRYAYGRARLASTALYSRVVAPEIARQVGNAEIVHSFSADMIGAAALRAARFRAVPFAITPNAHRGQWADDPASAGTYRGADAVVAVSESDATLYRELGVDPGRVAVIENSSPGVRAGGGDAIRRCFDIAGTLVLYLADKRPYKGGGLLVEAASRLSHQRNDISVAFVGPGPPVNRSYPGAPILDIGVVSEEERAAWLDAADILCLPSAAEAFGIVVLEAWSAGVPVITSDIASLRTLVQASGGGLAVKREPEAIADAICALADNPSLRQRLGEAGRKAWQERYRPERAVDDHERLYRSLLGMPSAG